MKLSGLAVSTLGLGLPGVVSNSIRGAAKNRLRATRLRMVKNAKLKRRVSESSFLPEIYTALIPELDIEVPEVGDAEIGSGLEQVIEAPEVLFSPEVSEEVGELSAPDITESNEETLAGTSTTDPLIIGTVQGLGGLYDDPSLSAPFDGVLGALDPSLVATSGTVTTDPSVGDSVQDNGEPFDDPSLTAAFGGGLSALDSLPDTGYTASSSDPLAVDVDSVPDIVGLYNDPSLDAAFGGGLAVDTDSDPADPMDTADPVDPDIVFNATNLVLGNNSLLAPP